MKQGSLRTGVIAAAVVVALAFSLVGCSSGGTAAAGADHSITVTASSEVKVVPDKARVNIAVVNEDGTAEKCRSANAETVNAVLAALSELGVDDESIQTSYASLSPRYGSRVSSNSDDEDADDWVIIGYEMTTQLSVSDLDIADVDAAVQKCVDAGANRTDGIEYYASDYDDAYNEALAEALATARDKASGIAGAAGVSLGSVIDVTEGYQDTSSRYVESYNDAFAATADVEDAGMSKTMPGKIGITANVTVSFAIS